MNKIYHDNGATFLERTIDEDGIEKIIVYQENGCISNIQHWKNKIPHGIFQEFDELGCMISENTYNHGKIIGPYILYFGNDEQIKENSIRRYTSYENSLKHGVEKQYIDDLYIETQWEQGVQTGVQKQYRSGTLETETPYINGLENGIEKRYTRAGDIWMTTNYVHGEKNGDETIYDSDGNIKNIEIYGDGSLYLGDEFNKKPKEIILYLHGWGGDCNSRLGAALEERLSQYQFIRPTLHLEDPQKAKREIESILDNLQPKIIVANSTSCLLMMSLASKFWIHDKQLYINPLIDYTTLKTIGVDKKILKKYDEVKVEPHELYWDTKFSMVLSLNDELLDISLAEDFFEKSKKSIKYVNDTHSLKKDSSIDTVCALISSRLKERSK